MRFLLNGVEPVAQVDGAMFRPWGLGFLRSANLSESKKRNHLIRLGYLEGLKVVQSLAVG